MAPCVRNWIKCYNHTVNVQLYGINSKGIKPLNLLHVGSWNVRKFAW